MQFLQFSVVVAGLCAHVMSQTPPDTSPATDSSLSVTYGTTDVTPGIRLPIELTSTIPTINHPSSNPSQKYHLLLVDLSIRKAQVNTSLLTPSVQLPLTDGISSDRTTRLHFWQPGIKFSSSGSLINDSSPIAHYQAPMPPPGDIPHTYVFYLFEQKAGFRPPPPGNPFNAALIDTKPSNRYSFNLNRLAAGTGVGSLVGANYITVQNTSPASSTSAVASASATATGTDTGTSALTSANPSASSFTGGAAGQMSPRASFVGGVATALIALAVAAVWSSSLSL